VGFHFVRFPIEEASKFIITNYNHPVGHIYNTRGGVNMNIYMLREAVQRSAFTVRGSLTTTMAWHIRDFVAGVTA